MSHSSSLRRRIKSIKNTRSITKAMEMVAASKMRRAQEQALKTRSYATKALEILSRVSEKIGTYPHYLLTKSPHKKHCLILLITSHKGLCGSLNTNIIRKLLEFISDQEKPSSSSAHSSHLAHSAHFSFVTLGKKGREALLRLKHNIISDFSDLGDNLSFLEVTPLIKFLLDEFRAKHYDRIYIIYTHFLSVLQQKAVIKRVVPLGKDIMESVKEVLDKKKLTEAEKDKETSYEYLFEPNPKQVLEELLPKLVEIQIYQAILESYASEHSARMVAMKNATEAASDLIDDLNLAYNKLRQASITQEIAEIIRGVAALEGSE